MTGRSSADRMPGLVFGAVLAAAGAVIAADSAGMQVPPGYSRIGPQVFPDMAALALVVAGAWFAWHGWRGGPERLRPDARRTDLFAVGAVVAGLVADILLIDSLGFIVASTVLFYAVAWGFGSRRPFVNAAWGLALSAAAYFVFTRWLHLPLPAGRLIGWS